MALKQLAIFVPILCAAITACSQREAIQFDPENDWHCAMSLRETMQAAKTAGNDGLATNMSFRANWALRKARENGIPQPTKEEAFQIQEYLMSSARAGTDAAIACRRRQNSDPNFPSKDVP